MNPLNKTKTPLLGNHSLTINTTITKDIKKKQYGNNLRNRGEFEILVQ